MRIISGSLKGKSIDFVRNSNTRPLKDSVKENVFNILKHSNLVDVKIENSEVLDLYSGIGSFGIESISRGANKVTFLEKDQLAFKILSENLNRLSISNKAELFNFEVESYLEKNKRGKFNIFFFDPPFLDNSFLKNLKLIKKNNLFKKKHIVIIHREKKNYENFGEYIDIVMTKLYGRSKIIFGKFNLNNL